MKPTLLLVSALALCSSILAAQNAIVAGPEGTIITATDAPATGHNSTYTLITFGSCPVRMQAKHGTGYGLVMTRGKQIPDSDRDTTKDSQAIHLSLAGGQQPVRYATIRVRGRTSHARIDRAATSDDQKYDIQRTLKIDLSPDADGASASDLTLPGFAVVGRLELLSFTYADGTIWRVEACNACTVSPDPFMLIADR